MNKEKYLKKTDWDSTDFDQPNKNKNARTMSNHHTNRSFTFYFKQQSRNVNTTSWLKFLIIFAIILGIAFCFSYFIQTPIPLIIIVIPLLIVLSVRVKRFKRIQFLNKLKMPPYIWDAFKQRHPTVSVVSHAQIEEGFKDYLAIHLWYKGAYAMPSHAVDALWHLLIEEYGSYYQQICQHALGYELIHKPHDAQPTLGQKSLQKKQLMNVWRGACHLHALDPEHPQLLPRLFQIDAQTRWENGIVFSLPFMIAMYVQAVGTGSTIPHTTISCTSTSSSSCSSSTSSCSSSSSDSNHASSSHSSDSDSSSCGSSCSSCGGGGGD